MSWPFSAKPGSECLASASCQSHTSLPSTGSAANLSFRRISAMRWMLRRASASSNSGWLSSRRAKVSMISCLERPVPRGPRTARMNGKPKRSLYAALSCWMRSNSSGVHCVRPALLCSWVDSAVRLFATMALPASSGWARIRANCASSSAVRTTCASACFRCARLRKGRCARASSAIQGECSYSPSSSDSASAGLAALSCSRVSGMVVASKK